MYCDSMLRPSNRRISEPSHFDTTLYHTGQKMWNSECQNDKHIVLSFSFVSHLKGCIFLSIDPLSAKIVSIGSTSSYHFGYYQKANLTRVTKVRYRQESYLKPYRTLDISYTDSNELFSMAAYSCRLYDTVKK